MKTLRLTFTCIGIVISTKTICFAEGAHVGHDASGLPGIVTVGVPFSEVRGLALAGTTGYGYSEGIVDGDSAHHRGIGRLAIAATPTDWLQFALRLDGRYEKHPADEEGPDDGLVGDPWLVTRVGTRMDQWAIGGELGLWFPGSEAPSVEFSATTAEAKFLATSLPDSGSFSLATMAGFRLDRSAESVVDADSLRQGDRISLGASDFNAVLLGVGGSYLLGETEILGEVSADLLPLS